MSKSESATLGGNENPSTNDGIREATSAEQYDFIDPGAARIEEVKNSVRHEGYKLCKERDGNYNWFSRGGLSYELNKFSANGNKVLTKGQLDKIAGVNSNSPNHDPLTKEELRAQGRSEKDVNNGNFKEEGVVDYYTAQVQDFIANLHENLPDPCDMDMYNKMMEVIKDHVEASKGDAYNNDNEASFKYFQDFLGEISEYAPEFPSIKDYTHDFGEKFAKDIGVDRVVGAVQETLPDGNDDARGREVEKETIVFAYDLSGLDSSVLDGVMSYTYKQYSEQQQIDPDLKERLVQGLREKQEGVMNNAPEKSNPVLDGVLKELDVILVGLGNAGEILSSASSRVGLSEGSDTRSNVADSVNKSPDVGAEKESTKWRDRVGGSNAATTRSQSQGDDPIEGR